MNPLSPILGFMNPDPNDDAAKSGDATAVNSPSASRSRTTSASSAVPPPQRQMQMQMPSHAMFISDPRTAQVRRNWLQHVLTNFRAISRSSKLLLILVCFIMVTEIIVGSFVLLIAHSTGEVCDSSLEIYLLVHVIRVILGLPLVIYQYLHPPIAEDDVVNGIPPSRTANSSNSNSVQRLQRQQQQQQHQQQQGQQIRRLTNHQRYQPHINKELSFLVDRVKSCLDAFGIIWFIVGNWMIFTSNGCHRTAPLMYYLTLVFLGMGYVLVSIPILMCGGIVFCLPCVLVWTRAFRTNGTDDGTGLGKVVASLGASDDVINAFPVLTFRKKNKPGGSNNNANNAGIEKKRSSGYSDPLLMAFPVNVGGGAVENRKRPSNHVSTVGNLLVDVNNLVEQPSHMVDATSAEENTPFNRSNSYVDVIKMVESPTSSQPPGIVPSPILPPRPRVSTGSVPAMSPSKIQISSKVTNHDNFVPPRPGAPQLPPKPQSFHLGGGANSTISKSTFSSSSSLSTSHTSGPSSAVTYPPPSTGIHSNSPLLAPAILSPKLPPRPQAKTSNMPPSSSSSSISSMTTTTQQQQQQQQKQQAPQRVSAPPPPVQRRPIKKDTNSLESLDGVIEMTLDDDESACVICLTNYEDGDGIKKLSCQHHFHVECVDEWLRLNKTCPLCKMACITTTTTAGSMV
ncbi:hypothetical protein BDR26DRAFT_855658 [Obelidium mucronatum]|nr:hypothetical protein BDR26DRAFT_855658 [Obelidium mucronatum]